MPDFQGQQVASVGICNFISFFFRVEEGGTVQYHAVSLLTEDVSSQSGPIL